MNIIDSHVHLPSPGIDFTWEWAPFTLTLSRAIEYLKRCGIHQIIANSVRGQIAKTHKEIIAGNDEIIQIANNNNSFVIPACLVNPNFASESLEEIIRCHELYKVNWIGELCNYIGGFSYTSNSFHDIVELATKLNMIIQIHNDDTQQMSKLCFQHPETTFILAHLGDSPEEVKERIQLASIHPNLYLDISGHGHQRMGVLELAVEIAGAEKVLFGSDYTINDPAGVIARIEKSYLTENIKQNILEQNVLTLIKKHKSNLTNPI